MKKLNLNTTLVVLLLFASTAGAETTVIKAPISRSSSSSPLIRVVKDVEVQKSDSPISISNNDSDVNGERRGMIKRDNLETETTATKQKSKRTVILRSGRSQIRVPAR